MKDKEKLEIKACPSCGNEDIKIETVMSRLDILSNSEQCIIDIKCNQCRTIKSVQVIGVDEKDCLKEAVRLWNMRANNG